MPGKKRHILLAAVFLLVILFVYPVLIKGTGSSESGGEPYIPGPDDTEGPNVTRTTRLLQPGTVRETALFIIAALEEGPTIMIMGGVHGDEIAGYLAADIIATWSIDRGTLLVLPRANAHAIDTETRYPPGTCDLNASFPGSAAGNPTERLASDIYQVMEEFRPQWVVDLHEAWEFERVQCNQLGQTIIYPHDGLALEVVEQIIEGLNRSIPEELHQFQVLRGGVKGGTIQASRSLGLETFTIETTRKLPLDDRINQHLDAVRLLMPILGINIIETGPD